MILQVIFTACCYMILSKFHVDSYVLFAANIEDFKNLANQIIPETLASQITSIAKNQSVDLGDDADEDASKDESDDEDESHVDEEKSDYIYAKVHPGKGEQKSQIKHFILKNETIDLDELVDRVKAKLQKDFEAAKTVKDATGKATVVGNFKQTKIEDYSYKDENSHGHSNKNGRIETRDKMSSNDVHNKGKEYEAPEYEVEYADYNEEDEKETPNYVDENSKTDYVQNKKGNNYNPSNFKEQLDSLANVKKIIRNDDDENDVKKYDNDGKIITIIEKDTENDSNYNDVKSQVLNTDNKEEYIPKKSQHNNKKVLNSYENKPEETYLKPSRNIIDDLFQEVDLRKPANDSYEDYVIPAKDDIFESIESTKTTTLLDQNIRKQNPEIEEVLRHRIPKAMQKVNVKQPVKVYDAKRDLTKVSHRPLEEIKAKTGAIQYKDPNIENYDESTNKVTGGDENTTKRKLRTMFPTKKHITMSSPNYFAKLPAVAETYNFNEPIPEQDREPEKIKHMNDPAAMINKKFKFRTED